MRGRTKLAGMLTILLLVSHFVFSEESGGKVLVLHGVTLIDGTGAAERKDMSVVIRGNRIEAVGKAKDINAPVDAVILDCHGKFLIPGLWDMHVHWYDSNYLRLFVANGVTGIRLMWGMPEHFEWRKREAAGSLIGPRLVIGSPIIDGPIPIWPGSVAVGNEQEARKAVDQARQDGAEFIKVYSMLPRDAYFAIADESKKLGIPFAGHVPFSVSASEASDAGQKSIEHLTGIALSASTRETEFRKELTDAAGKGYQGIKPVGKRQAEPLLASYSEAKAKEMFQHFVKNGTWQTPTLTVLRSTSYMDDPNFINDPRLKYMPQSIREQWNPKSDFRLADRTAEDYAVARKVYKKDLDIVRDMNRAGVRIIAGTDTLNPYCFPGFSLHDELALLTQAGLTPMQALQSATRNAAEYLGQLDSYGTVETHKIADLVLLSADPLQDIRNTTAINAVILDGHLYSKDDLEKMKSDVESMANKKSIADAISISLMQKGVAAAIDRYHKLKDTAADTYDFGEDELNTLGFQLMGKGKSKEAIAILKLNVESFPESWNAYDSLGEAYLADGDRENAATNYRKSLELNHQNQNATDKLSQISEAQTQK